MTATTEQLSRLRRQRSVLIATAVVLLSGSMGVSIPRARARQDKWKAASAELVGLQEAIVTAQNRTRKVQEEILKGQVELRELRTSK